MSTRAVSVRRAPAHAPRSRPAVTPRRPPLRVVGRDELSPRARRRRARLAVAAAGAFLVLALFGVAAFHVVLTQGQFRLERIEGRAAEAQARYERLREQVAELESPGRVVAAAQERLGMVPPAGVTYLSPAGSAEGSGSILAPAPGRERPASSWSTVKPHLEPEP